MANNQYVNKVEYNGQTLVNLTNDTVTPSDVLNGVSFHDRSGTPQQGNLIVHNVYDGLDSISTSDALSANQGRVLKSETDDLSSKFARLQNGPIITDCNDAILVGNYAITGTQANRPFDYGILTVDTYTNGGWIVQTATDVLTARQYRRIKNDVWSGWVEVSGIPTTVSVPNGTGWDSSINSSYIKIGKLVIANIYGTNISGGALASLGSGFPTPDGLVNIPLCNYGAGGAGMNTVWAYISNGSVVTRETIAYGNTIFGTFAYSTSN